MAFSAAFNYCKMQKLEDTEFFKTLQEKLKEDTWYKPLLDYAETSTKLNRVYIATGIFSPFFIVYLIKCLGSSIKKFIKKNETVDRHLL